MMRYALLNDQDQFVWPDQFREFATPPTPLPGKPTWRFLPAPPAVLPTYDPVTQVLEGPVYTIGPTDVTEAYMVRNLTPQELSSRKDRDAQGFNDALLKVIHNLNNRVLTLEGKPNVTIQQTKQAIRNLM